MLTAYASEPANPGTGTYGFVVYRNGEKIGEGHGPAGEQVTNNYSEYFALVRALTSISSNADEPIVVKSDSKLLVNQMSGEWKVKRGAYLPKYKEAKELTRRFKSLKFAWVPRERNAEADELSRRAYAELKKGR
ncbi:MAG: ribonuclease HI family protein [Thaumarchaeota archaeon]|nr:ribonuclease HI family protein [Nitrososphaerota archaeon]